MSIMEEGKKRLRISLFQDVPPYHVFLPTWLKYEDPTCSGLQHEEWQFPAQILPVVRETVEHAGFKVVKGVLRGGDEKETIPSGHIWDNLPLVEKEMDAIDFSRLRHAVKINKFPGFRDLNRKDLLWKNFRRMQTVFGRTEFGFHPDTFILPNERKQLIARMKQDNFNTVYIVKLPNNFCGIGACVINDPKMIPRKTKIHQERSKKVVKEDPIIVQQYLPEPYLINGYKFDLRIYVLITSVEPLRIYLYRNGLVRFATEKYSLDKDSLDNTFIHLTNFTVNKKGETVTDYPPGTQVNKWSITEFWQYMKEKGVDLTDFWEDVKDVVIKTVLCARDRIISEVRVKSSSFYNNFNLLGLDIFVSKDLKPSLLEVNTIPSLFVNNISKEIDTQVKAPMIAEMMNICGHHISTSTATKYRTDIIKSHLPNYVSKNLGFDHRLYNKVLLPEEERKQEHFVRAFTGNVHSLYAPQLSMNGSSSNGKIEEDNCNGNDEEEDDQDDDEDDDEEEEDESNEDDQEDEKDEKLANVSQGSANKNTFTKCSRPNDILDNLTPCDVRVLVHSEDELTETDKFERIFPRLDTDQYLHYMTTPSYYDLLLSTWEQRYSENPREGLERLQDLCEQGLHLKVPETEKKIKVERSSPKPFKKSNYNVPHIFRDK